LVINEVLPGSEWVQAGLGRATVKYDGTCIKMQDGEMYKRYDRKMKDFDHKVRLYILKNLVASVPAMYKELYVDFQEHVLRSVFGLREDCYKATREGWQPAQDPDPVSGHWPGWMPVGDGPEDKYHREAMEWYTKEWGVPPDGTYELVGEKINGNPENIDGHQLWRHGGESIENFPRSYDEIKQYFETMSRPYMEGVVWYHEDGRMVKIKRRDFGLKWPDNMGS
jgi:hypothetical protein